MRLQISESKNSQSFYLAKSFRDPRTGKYSSKIVKKLGTRAALEKKLGPRVDLEAWGRKQAAKLAAQENRERETVMVPLRPSKQIAPGQRKLFKGGYLFLQKILYGLGIDKICSDITKEHSFDFDLLSIFSRLVYGRVLEPCSKRATHKFSKTLIEPPSFEAHHVYRGLEVLFEHSEFIQAQLYKNSRALTSRADKILYYDCTNFYFEIEEEDDFRRYGPSKQHQPSPLVQMGLFMDASGMPLAFSMSEGSKNEQTTLAPLEKTILKDFGLSKFIVCTDAGLSSTTNKKFNSRANRAFVTTQSIKKLKKHLSDWALEKSGWQMHGADKIYDLNEVAAQLDSNKLDEKTRSLLISKTFYKQRLTKEKIGASKEYFEQRLIVTFSFKYLAYQRKIRQGQIDRALRDIKTASVRLGKVNANDYRRFIKKTSITEHGEQAATHVFDINDSVIEREARFDGFYGLATSLGDDDIEGILKVNANRWRIEECFRIIKTELKARPAFLQRKDRITAHFLICFIALLVYRILEAQIGDDFTCEQIISTLRNFDFKQVRGEGWEPLYTRNELTDRLHDVGSFRSDFEIVTNKKMKEIIRHTKKK